MKHNKIYVLKLFQMKSGPSMIFGCHDSPPLLWFYRVEGVIRINFYPMAFIEIIANKLYSKIRNHLENGASHEKMQNGKK